MREYQVRICERLGVQFPGPTRHCDGGDHHDHGDHYEHSGQAEALLDPQEGRDRHKGSDTTGGLAEPEAGGAGVGREHLGDEDLRRISPPTY